MLFVNTGNGKGKTTAAIGQVIRALGRGYKVCIIQLFKGKEFYGEQNVLATLKNLELHSFAQKHPFCFREIDPKLVKKQCSEALAFAGRKMASGKYELVVLEEFNIAVREGFITVKDLLKVINQNTKNIKIIVTGRGAKKALLSKADLVTEMKEIKHYFKKGVKAIKGIEF